MNKMSGIVVICGFVMIGFALMLVTGCSSMEKAIDRAEDVSLQAIDNIERADDLYLEVNEKRYCGGATNGALSRRYGNNPELVQAYNDLCAAVASSSVNRPMATTIRK